jgi:hypothetical protein
MAAVLVGTVAPLSSSKSDDIDSIFLRKATSSGLSARRSSSSSAALSVSSLSWGEFLESVSPVIYNLKLIKG